MIPKNRQTAIAVLLILALASWAWLSMDLQAHRLGLAPRALAGILSDAWPPDLAGPFLRDVLTKLLETLRIAILATVLGAILALPIALMGARNLAPRPLVVAARACSAALRVLPDLVWAMVAVLVLGFGPLAGLVAVTLYTIGFLSKLQYEALEGIPRDALEAAAAMGATRFQRAWHVALPEAGNALRSQMLFMFEYNVRESSIVGVVGAGGIGQLLDVHFRFFNYNRIMTILLGLFAVVSLLDLGSIWIRRRFVEVDANYPGRPAFLHVLTGRYSRPRQRE